MRRIAVITSARDASIMTTRGSTLPRTSVFLLAHGASPKRLVDPATLTLERAFFESADDDFTLDLRPIFDNESRSKHICEL